MHVQEGTPSVRTDDGCENAGDGERTEEVDFERLSYLVHVIGEDPIGPQRDSGVVDHDGRVSRG
jgi:hypothetical protein